MHCSYTYSKYLCTMGCVTLDQVAYTHLPGNTAFRGFGVPQSAMICENMMEAVARHLGVSPEHVRKVNLLPNSQTSGNIVRMATGQRLHECHLPRIWKLLNESASIAERRRGIDEFNHSSAGRKRGLAVVPTCYGINFPLKYLNQVSVSDLVDSHLPISRFCIGIMSKECALALFTNLLAYPFVSTRRGQATCWYTQMEAYW